MLNGLIIKPTKKLSDEGGFYSEVSRVDWKDLCGEEYMQVVQMSGNYRRGLKALGHKLVVHLYFSDRIHNYNRLYEEHRLWVGQTPSKSVNCKKDDQRSGKPWYRNSRPCR